jgi:hypothetical protein
VRLIVSDKCLGLVESVAEFYPEAKWQRCVVHFYRNVWTAVPTGKVKEVAAMLKAIHAQEDKEAARKKAADVVEKLKAMKLAKASELVKEDIEETLQYMDFPREHWRSLRTNNPLERIMREIRCRTRVVGAFPDGNSALMLVVARLRHVAATSKLGQQALSRHELAQRESCDEGFQGGLTNFFLPPWGREKKPKNHNQFTPNHTNKSAKNSGHYLRVRSGTRGRLNPECGMRNAVARGWTDVVCGNAPCGSGKELG